jgi:hypothetical protein
MLLRDHLVAGRGFGPARPITGIACGGSAVQQSEPSARRSIGTAHIRRRVSTPIRACSVGVRPGDAHIGRSGRTEDLEAQRTDVTLRIVAVPRLVRYLFDLTIGQRS